MVTKTVPGRFNCYANAAPDEPIFVLLARDPQAPGLVRKWAKGRRHLVRCGRKPEADIAMADEARAVADAMEAWRAKTRP